jgi:hypothetical protein
MEQWVITRGGGYFFPFNICSKALTNVFALSKLTLIDSASMMKL